MTRLGNLPQKPNVALTDPGHYYYAIELDVEQRRAIIEYKGFKDTPDHAAEPQIRRFLQALVNKTLPVILKGGRR